MPKKQLTPVRIIETTRDSGLTTVQRNMIDASEHTVIQYPFMTYEMQQVIEHVKARVLKPEHIPNDMPATHKALLQCIYKKKKKPIYFSAITHSSYTEHLADCYETAKDLFVDAEDEFYFSTIDDTICKAKAAFQSFITFKQGLEQRLSKDIQDLTNKIVLQNPRSICYVTLGETPQIADSLQRHFNESNKHKLFVQKTFELDFKTTMYRKFSMHKFSSPSFDLSDTDYLKLVIHEILMNLSINESDLETQNYRLEQPWLNTVRNQIISSFSTQDIIDMHKSAINIEHGWDKSLEFIAHFEQHMPKGKKAAYVHADRYLRTGFNLLKF
jgi:hypothetical protein